MPDNDKYKVDPKLVDPKSPAPEPFDPGEGREPRFIYDSEQMVLRPVRSLDEWERGEPQPPTSETQPTNPQENIPLDPEHAPKVPEGTRAGVGGTEKGRTDFSVPQKQQPVQPEKKIDSPVLTKDSRAPLSPNKPAAGENPNPNSSPGLKSTKD